MLPAGETARDILVVEDDDATREALSLLLRGEGYVVTAAANGQEALDRLRAGLRPRLIVLDLMMPVLDGWAFRAEQLRDPSLAGIPVVVCSGVSDLSRQAGALGAAAVLPKPVEFDRLATTILALAGADRPGVLVVDDDPSIRRLLELVLARQGLTVWSAASGREAADLYRRHRDRIGAVLLDVQMPELDGPWTLAELRRVNPQVRAVFISGNTGDYDVELLLKLGARAVLQKPFDLGELSGTIGRLLSG